MNVSSTTFVWQSFGSDNGDTEEESIQGQLFFADGNALGPQFLVNSFTANEQRQPAVAMGPTSDFVVWNSLGSYGTDTSLSIQGQRFQ